MNRSADSKVYFIEDEHYGCTSKIQTITSLQTTSMENLPKLRNQANARERYRTYSVNSAFTMLRQLIPTEPQNRKLSKIETLRLATSYIEHLDAILSTGNSKQPCIYIMNKPDLLLIKNYIRNRSNICTFCVATKNT